MSATAVTQAEERPLTIGAVCRLLHGKIDILRAELVSRLQQQEGGGEGPLSEVDVDKLAAILAGKAAPPAEG